jgi:hypothetical protein
MITLDYILKIGTLAVGLLIVALSLKTESLVLLRDSKDLPKLGRKFKITGTVFVVIAVVFFAVGVWFSYHPNVNILTSEWLGLAGMLVIPGMLIAVKGARLTEKQPEKLGRYLHNWVRVIIWFAIFFLIVAVVLVVLLNLNVFS